jgi:hypothetical protein
MGGVCEIIYIFQISDTIQFMGVQYIFIILQTISPV